MYLLGIHGSKVREFEDAGPNFEQHDGAAVLVRDHEIVAAIEEERLNRVKHSNFFPLQAIRFCLDTAGIGLGEVDRVVFNFSERALDMYQLRLALGIPSAQSQPARIALGALLEEEFQVDVTQRIQFCHHHIAHAVSAYYASGYDRALVMTLDGSGDGLCGMVLQAAGGELKPIREVPDVQSLGNWYTILIKILGYSRFDEYKVMGLAPLGDPKVYESLFRRCYKLLPGGNYELAPFAEQLNYLQQAGVLAKARRKGEPFTQVHKDFAAGLQAALEEIALHIMHHFRDATGEENLCLAGGVAHNCSMNGRILYSGLFKRMFVQPAAHDAGTALGAVWKVLHDEGHGRPSSPMTHVYLGSDLPAPDEIGRILESWEGLVSFEKVERIAERTAGLLTEGAVVGWVQGRSEFGPRALGNRSILADPRPPDNKDRINRMIKKREGYRPFAPSVIEERVSDFFETVPGNTEFPFMIFVLGVREAWRAELGAITHVDGTARAHTVSRQDNPRYWDLLDEFSKRTGVPMLLNTSFNNNAEPIVDSAEDAIACYLTTGLTYLVLGDYLVCKGALSPADPAYGALAPSLRQNRKLVRRDEGMNGISKMRYFIESTANDFFCESKVEIAEDLFLLLLAADHRRSIAELMDSQGIQGETRRQELVSTLVDLWGRRVVVLQPPAL